MDFTIGVPKESGIYEIRGVQNGEIQDLRHDFEKISTIVHWTVTPEGAWFRVEFDFDSKLQDWILVTLDAAAKPEQDMWTTPLIPLDYKSIAYRPVQGSQ